MFRKKYFISNYYPGDSFIMIAPIIWGLTLAILNEFVPANIINPIAKVIFACNIITYSLLFFTWFFESLNKEDLEKAIKSIQYGRKPHDYDENDLSILEDGIRQLNKSNKRHIHLLKSYKNVSGKSAQLFSIYFIISLICNQVAFKSWMPYSMIVLLILLTIAIIIAFGLLLIELKESGIINTGALLGDLLMIGIFFFGFYHAYTKNFGSEIIGSFFEKHEYKTQYYVNLFADKGYAKNYRVVADVHVYSTTEEDGEDTYTTKHIVIERVYWPNGGYSIFDDCELESGDNGYCTDNDDRTWYIELTNKKPKRKAQ